MQGLEGRSKWATRMQKDPHKLSSDGKEDWEVGSGMGRV